MLEGNLIWWTDRQRLGSHWNQLCRSRFRSKMKEVDRLIRKSGRLQRMDQSSVPWSVGSLVRLGSRIQHIPCCGIGGGLSLRQCKAWRPVKNDQFVKLGLPISMRPNTGHLSCTMSNSSSYLKNTCIFLWSPYSRTKEWVTLILWGFIGCSSP